MCGFGTSHSSHSPRFVAFNHMNMHTHCECRYVQSTAVWMTLMSMWIVTLNGDNNGLSVSVFYMRYLDDIHKMLLLYKFQWCFSVCLFYAFALVAHFFSILRYSVSIWEITHIGIRLRHLFFFSFLSSLARLKICIFSRQWISSRS